MFCTETPTVPLVPPTKMRINISGLDIAAKSQTKAEEESKDAVTDQAEQGGVSPNNIEPHSPSISDSSDKPNAEIVFTEELKRLKPRLVGRKLVNQPPKLTGKEESGLCVIC